MKHCAICGQAAQRGSICQHCRAALKRARDQTVSQFQALPALAMVAGAAPAGDLRIGRSVPDRRGARQAPPRAKREPEHIRKPRMPLPTVQGSVLLEVPPGTRGAPFVWVIVTLMVFVVTYVAYRVFTTASEPVAATAPATSTEPSAVPEPAAMTSAVPARDSQSAQPSEQPPATEPSAAAATSAPIVSNGAAMESRGADAAPAAASKAAPVSKGIERRAPASPAAPDNRGAVSPKESLGPATPARPTLAPGTARLDNEGSAPEARPARVASASAPTPRSRESARNDHWQRMASAIRACVGQDFLGGVLCEQKVRIEYCEGYWGQTPECPGGLVNDHGQ